MQAALGSRKRPAPGTSPIPFQQPQPQFHHAPQVTEEQFSNWDASLRNASINPYPDPSFYSPQLFSSEFTAPLPADGVQLAPAPTPASNQLVRRNTNQQVTPRQQWQAVNDNDEIWNDFGGALGGHTGLEQSEQEEDLDRRAAASKRQALAERKQIPPFILKLSSFLDDPKYSDLIRWAPDGKSFIVLDEDEFGKKVIPERFKHNNYASFVRQLNMYGFHKNVGLSDNSMRSSENKTKSPSQYTHPYFRQGKPDYLWLIKKPKSSVPSSKRKKDGTKEQESDDETKRYGSVEREEEAKPPTTDGRVDATSSGRSQELVTLPKSELAAIQQELESIQRSQRFISNVIHRLREQNNQLYQQAAAFQTLHDRHENSINAILTFLATFYNRSLEGFGGQNLANLFNHDVSHNTPEPGSVVDIGEPGVGNPNAANQVVRSGRRPQLLLPPPVPVRRVQDGHTPGSVSTASAATPAAATSPPTSTRFSPSPPQRAQNLPYRNSPHDFKGTFTSRPASGGSQSAEPQSVEPVFKHEAPAPDSFQQARPNQYMLSVINNLNQTTSNTSASISDPSSDLSSALQHFERTNGKGPLTTEQRSNMLSLIANSGNTSNSNDATGILTAASSALTTPQPPPGPDLNRFAATREELDMLQKLQEEQDAKMQNLADRLQPLSPSGTIPGFPSGGGGGNATNTTNPSQATGDFDFDNFLNDGDYFGTTQPGDTNFAFGSGLPDNDFNFAFGSTGGGADGDWGGLGDGITGPVFGDGQVNLGPDGEGGRVESINSSETTSPANTAMGVDERTSSQEGVEQDGSPRAKKRKRS